MDLKLALPLVVKYPVPDFSEEVGEGCRWLNLIRKLFAALRERGEIEVELTEEER